MGPLLTLRGDHRGRTPYPIHLHPKKCFIITMAAASGCRELAIRLSENYRNTEPFSPSSVDEKRILRPQPPPQDDNSSSSQSSHRFTATTTTTTGTTTWNNHTRMAWRRTATTAASQSSIQRQLSRYLSTHGILLSMCFPLQCTIPMTRTHMSASWINALTGPQVVTTQSHVGLLLDPTSPLIQIHCLYPSDAVSAERQDQGCGPLDLDPHFPSYQNEHEKQILHQQIRQFKNLNFGVHTNPWTKIDCSDYFAIQHAELIQAFTWRPRTINATSHNETRTKYSQESSVFEIQPLYSIYQEQHAAIVGHPVCKVSDQDLAKRHGSFWIYAGSFGYPPEQWQEMIDIQLQFLRGHDLTRNSTSTNKNKGESEASTTSSSYTVEGFWNEIVMALPYPEKQDAVLGVFYLDDNCTETRGSEKKDSVSCQARRLQAQREARVLGGKPVLRMHSQSSRQQQDANVLTCLDEDQTGA